jgi:lipid-A-disaccharide synthase
MSGESGPHIFLVAGEESGDRLGAALIDALRRESKTDLRFSAVGGTHMADKGVPSLFPLGDLAIIGFSAIVLSLPKILKRIAETADAVVAAKPDVLVIIDSPEFTHRVARRVRARAPQIRIVDYVCPSVWAWRPGRARAMRAYVDRVLALLPFEPQAMRTLNGPPTSFVGHPLAEQVAELRPNPDEARRRLADPPLLLVLPGSRSGEIRRMAGVFGEAVAAVIAKTGPLDVVVPAVPRLADAVRAAVRTWPVPARVVTDAADKYAAFRQARAALTKSGTSTLELALAGVPMVAAYRVSPLEALVGWLMIRAQSAILTNLVLGENVVPEFLQQQCTPANLAAALVPLVADTAERRRQLTAFNRLDSLMDIGGPGASHGAAKIVLEYTPALTTSHAKV